MKAMDSMKVEEDMVDGESVFCGDRKCGRSGDIGSAISSSDGAVFIQIALITVCVSW
jgi:hypothetical protein